MDESVRQDPARAALEVLLEPVLHTQPEIEAARKTVNLALAKAAAYDALMGKFDDDPDALKKAMQKFAADLMKRFEPDPDAPKKALGAEQ